MQRLENSFNPNKTAGRRFRAFILGAAVLAVALTFIAPNSIALGADKEKKLTKSEARLLVKNLDGEMSQVLYVMLVVPGVKEQRDAFSKRWKARGSMKGKTRTKVIDLYIEDVRAAFTDAELRDRIIEAINRFAESGR